MADHRQFCEPCFALFFRQPPEGSEVQHLTGNDLKQCAESLTCDLCASLWMRLSDQQKADISIPYKPGQHDEKESGEVLCSYENHGLHFELPIPYALRERSYGSSMPQFVDITIESSLFGSRFLGNLAGNDFASTTFTDSTAKLAASWVDHCIGSHSHSKLAIGQSFQPTRLVNVGTVDHPTISLCESNSISRHERYITLSHRWGTGKILLLKTDNVQDMMCSISPNDLSKNFNDAIKVTRMLGISYIWIDSLCIIQDSKEDWVREASRMADCYEFSYCTLSASASGDHDLGLILNRNPSTVGDMTLDLREPDDAKQRSKSNTKRLINFAKQTLRVGSKPDGHLLPLGTYVCKDIKAWSREVDGSPLSDRGWIYQERLLSSRIIHFGQTRIFFECPEQQCSENRPKQVDKYIYAQTDFKNTSPQALLSRLAGNEEVLAQHAPTIWAEIISRYSRCPLTYWTDRLVAAGGVARRFESLMSLPSKNAQTASRIKLTKDNQQIPVYFLGIWLCNEHTLANLCWSVRGDPAPRPKELDGFVPTWTFGSVATGVIFGPIALSVDTSDKAVDLATIVKLDVDFDADPTSKLAMEDAMWTCRIKPNTGAIWFECSLIPVTLSTEALDAAAAPDCDDPRAVLTSAGTWEGNPVMVINGEPQRWSFTTDVLRSGSSEDLHGWSGQYVAAGLCSKASEAQVYGIVLERVDQESGCFRRVGQFSLGIAEYDALLENVELDSHFFEERIDKKKVRIKVV